MDFLDSDAVTCRSHSTRNKTGELQQSKPVSNQLIQDKRDANRYKNLAVFLISTLSCIVHLDLWFQGFYIKSRRSVGERDPALPV